MGYISILFDISAEWFMSKERQNHILWAIISISRYQQNGLCQAVGSSSGFFRVITQGSQKTKHFSTPDALRLILNKEKKAKRKEKGKRQKLRMITQGSQMTKHFSTPDALRSD